MRGLGVAMKMRIRFALLERPPELNEVQSRILQRAGCVAAMCICSVMEASGLVDVLCVQHDPPMVLHLWEVQVKCGCYGMPVLGAA
jgi:hypothetical protein